MSEPNDEWLPEDVPMYPADEFWDYEPNPYDGTYSEE